LTSNKEASSLASSRIGATEEGNLNWRGMSARAGLVDSESGRDQVEVRVARCGKEEEVVEAGR
jgi:hypothetical protein